MRTTRKRRQATETSYVERINRAIDHILSHLDQPLRLNDVARAAMLSPFHCHRVFQALVGATPGDFIKRVRLDRALFMMAHAGRSSSLTQIALACGFSSSSDFSRCFKQRFGTAPSAFDLKAWRRTNGARLQDPAVSSEAFYLDRLPESDKPDEFNVRIRSLPARTVAYIRVANPYEGTAVIDAVNRLVAWADRHGFGENQWLGYQWENPEITPIEHCRYHAAVEVDADRFTPRGEIGRFDFEPMMVAEVQIRGEIDVELRALQWLFGTWLPRSKYVPADHPCFEAWDGRPFAHGMTHFELRAHLPIRRGT